jgi:hypothetical protein
VALGSLLAYLLSQWHDIWAYHLIRAKTGKRLLWLRNNASTLVSQLIDSLVFCLIAFWGVFSASVWLEILLTTYLIKALSAGLDTPFIYLARHLQLASFSRTTSQGGSR